MFVVIARVPVQPGRIDETREFFERVTPGLVQDQSDWLEAKFTANLETSELTVLAFWRNADSYRAFSSGEKFREAMAQAIHLFAGPPQVSINEVLSIYAAGSPTRTVRRSPHS